MEKPRLLAILAFAALPTIAGMGLIHTASARHSHGLGHDKWNEWLSEFESNCVRFNAVHPECADHTSPTPQEWADYLARGGVKKIRKGYWIKVCMSKYTQDMDASWNTACKSFLNTPWHYH